MGREVQFPYSYANAHSEVFREFSGLEYRSEAKSTKRQRHEKQEPLAWKGPPVEADNFSHFGTVPDVLWCPPCVRDT